MDGVSGSKKDEQLLLSESEEAKEQAKLFKRLNSNRKPGIVLICSKLFPCFSCCSNRSAQIVQGTFPSSPASESRRISKRNSLRKVRASTNNDHNNDLNVVSRQTSENSSSNNSKNVLQTVDQSASPLQEPRQMSNEETDAAVRKSVMKESPYEETPSNRFKEKKPSMLQRITSSIAESLTDFAKARDEDLNEDEGVEPQFNKDVNKF
jgi:hypothetical protein